MGEQIKSNEDGKKYSLDLIFQKRHLIHQNKIPKNHPLNHLTELEDDLFGHIDVQFIPSANKRRKILRRMERKLNEDIKIPEPHIDTMQNKNHTKWDVRHNCVNTFESKTKSTITTTKQIKKCKPQNLYTIKNNKIIKLDLKQPNSISQNKMGEKLLDETKLTLQQIKLLPRFQNYDPGVSSNVLYLKNLAKHLVEEDLLELFKTFDENVKISLLHGKMRGQAFITFTSEMNAVKSLNEINGTLVKGKPIIIQFGKCKK